MDFISPVLNLVGSQLIAEYARIHGISDKLNSCGEKLHWIQDVLDSAEEKQMYDDDRATARWLADLRDVAYDMEDLLDHFSVEAKQAESKEQSSKRPHCLIARSSPLRPRALISGHHLANEIDDIDRRLKDVYEKIPLLQLVRNSRSERHSYQPRFETTSLPEPKFVGREKQMEELLPRLTRSESTQASVQPFTVVSIVGMGGLGKTTLAQQLYNHESLKKANFTVKAWVCVSEVFDVSAITKCILDKFAEGSGSGYAPSSSSAKKYLDQLQRSLKDELSGKKFLLVLDDVWKDKYEELESLLKPLYSGSKGSKILLTTRNLEVARLMGDPDSKQLELLSEEESLSLLACHSIGEKNFEGHPHLQEISVQLAKKCKGLPLSIKAIGGMLRFKTDDEQWKQVLTHGSWDGEGEKIPPALKLSYVHLPIHLKRCFAACALFPKDYVFDQDELIRLWIIQGLLQKGTARTFREVGMENLRRLEALSFLQRARDDKNCYSMHDLMNDLAKSVDARSYFSSDEFKEGSTSCEVLLLDKVRHAALVTQCFEHCRSKIFEAFHSMKKLRTFMPFQITEHQNRVAFVFDDVIQDLIVDIMKNLRMLSLRFFKITQVPDQIGELKLLRSIDVSHTGIEVLPESICDLVELQSLLLRGCVKLQKLPRNIHKLANLLHLDITGTEVLQVMPPRIGDLKNLEILSDFIVGKEVGQELKQLGPLVRLQRELRISNLFNVDDVEDAWIANISGKEAVLKLSLDWGSCSEISRDDSHQCKLLEYLQPPRKIESLEIRHYGAKTFPKWFDNHYSMNNVMSITLSNCESLDSLPPLGQLPLLESLDIRGLRMVSSIGPEFYGSRRPFFRSLKRLTFYHMRAWEKWLYNGEENDSPFPCLRQLIGGFCHKLKGGCTLSLPSLVEANIVCCDVRFLKCLVGLTSMTKMEISLISELVHFEGSLSTSWTALEEMRIERCPQFKFIVGGDGGKRVPPNLKVLKIVGCGEFEELVHFEGSLSTSWTALEEIRITGCPQFKFIVGGDGGKRVPPNLKVLQIDGCGEFEKLPEELSELTSLNEMSIEHCEKLCSFPSGGLPASLRKLEVQSCPKMPQSQLISIRLLDYLDELSLYNLEGLVSITKLVDVGSPPSRSLRKLKIRYCESLATLTDSLQHLSALSHLNLTNCPALEMEIFPSLPCNLSKFNLDNCPKVKSLPYNMHHLTSLKKLYIQDCEGITSLSSRGGLPPNLEILWIQNCRNLNQPLEEWGLRGLTALQGLSIEGEMECVDEMECFPPSVYDGDWSRFLPSSLLCLSIVGMKKLGRVGGGLRHHLTSLKALFISNCPRLRWLPDDGLPDSLERFFIKGCTDELEKKCMKGKGEYWHSHLRLIPEFND